MHSHIKNMIVSNKGSIPISDFINTVLYHEKYGYYIKKVPFGMNGDFITAPEISQLFGEVISIWLMYHWQQIKEPDEFIVVELGPGRGTLMKDIIRVTKKFKKFYNSMTIHLVEVSPILIELQKKNLNSLFEDFNFSQISKQNNFNTKIFWHNSINTLPNKPILLIANEFFDALPIEQFIYIDNSWYENHITINNNKFQIIKKPTTKNLQINVNPNSIIEVCTAAKDIMVSIERKILQNSGAALIIDYGYTEPPYISTIQAISKHQYHDFLKDVGKCDITSYVDFHYLMRSLTKLNPTLLSQREFLFSFGIRERLQTLLKIATDQQKKSLTSSFLRLTENMGSIFKALTIHHI